MLVKEILAIAAFESGRIEVAKELEKEAPSMEDQTDLLVRSYNLVENEVALDYFPLIKRETFLTKEGAISFSDFAEMPVDVHAVKDSLGRDVRFEIFPDRLILPADTGEVEVTYAYAPLPKTMDDESAFSGKVSARLLALGTASEYCLARGLYDEAAMFEKRYHDALRAANIYRRKLNMLPRRWV